MFSTGLCVWRRRRLWRRQRWGEVLSTHLWAARVSLQQLRVCASALDLRRRPRLLWRFWWVGGAMRGRVRSTGSSTRPETAMQCWRISLRQWGVRETDLEVRQGPRLQGQVGWGGLPWVCTITSSCGISLYNLVAPLIWLSFGVFFYVNLCFSWDSFQQIDWFRQFTLGNWFIQPFILTLFGIDVHLSLRHILYLLNLLDAALIYKKQTLLVCIKVLGHHHHIYGRIHTSHTTPTMFLKGTSHWHAPMGIKFPQIVWGFAKDNSSAIDHFFWLPAIY